MQNNIRQALEIENFVSHLRVGEKFFKRDSISLIDRKCADDEIKIIRRQPDPRICCYHRDLEHSMGRAKFFAGRKPVANHAAESDTCDVTNTRLFGRMGQAVGEIGLGCWQLGGTDWGGLSDMCARTILLAAMEPGSRFATRLMSMAAERARRSLARS